MQAWRYVFRAFAGDFVRLLAVTLLGACRAAAQPIAVVDDHGAPWITLHPDGRLVHASGEAVGRYDPASDTLAVSEVPASFDPSADPAFRRTPSGVEIRLFDEPCTLASDGAVACNGVRGRMTPPPALDDPRVDALLMATAIYRPPQPVGVVVGITWAGLRREHLLVEAGAGPDGTLWSGGVCPTWSADCEGGEVAGRWSDTTLTWRGVEAPRPPIDPSRGCAVQRPGLCVLRDPEGGWTVTDGERARVDGSIVTLRRRDDPPPPALSHLALVAAASVIAERIDAVSAPPPPPPPPPP